MSRYKITPTKPGQSPGTLTYIGKETLRSSKITLIEYNEKEIEERALKTLDECHLLRPSSKISWLNVDGISDTAAIEAIGKCYDLHPLLLEDVLNTGQKPKIEYYDNHVFVVLKMLDYNVRTQEIETEHVSLVLGRSYVISFQEEREGDVFDPIRLRMRKLVGRIRKAGADYLFYALIDTIVDNYFVVIENLSERLEDLETEIIEYSSSKSLGKLYAQKRELILMRKAVWPVREILSGLVRGESPLITKSVIIYLRDVYDHTIQVIDTVESYRDLIGGLLDIYLSTLSNRMNSVMKVLTIFSTIFMPLTFIAGIYGMNFDFMPELRWKYGYPVSLAVMLAISIAMLFYFRRKRWL